MRKKNWISDRIRRTQKPTQNNDSRITGRACKTGGGIGLDPREVCTQPVRTGVICGCGD